MHSCSKQGVSHLADGHAAGLRCFARGQLPLRVGKLQLQGGLNGENFIPGPGANASTPVKTLVFAQHSQPFTRRLTCTSLPPNPKRLHSVVPCKACPVTRSPSCTYLHELAAKAERGAAGPLEPGGGLGPSRGGRRCMERKGQQQQQQQQRGSAFAARQLQGTANGCYWPAAGPLGRHGLPPTQQAASSKQAAHTVQPSSVTSSAPWLMEKPS